MKKIAFIITLAISSVALINANNPVNPIVSSAQQVLFCKVINNTSAVFEYKVGTEEFTIPVGQTGGFAFEENTQILKKDTHGHWVNWFIFSSSYQGQSIQLSDIINLSN